MSRNTTVSSMHVAFCRRYLFPAQRPVQNRIGPAIKIVFNSYVIKHISVITRQILTFSVLKVSAMTNIFTLHIRVIDTSVLLSS
jgi:hypothetical protein